MAAGREQILQGGKHNSYFFYATSFSRALSGF